MGATVGRKTGGPREGQVKPRLASVRFAGAQANEAARLMGKGWALAMMDGAKLYG